MILKTLNLNQYDFQNYFYVAIMKSYPCRFRKIWPSPKKVPPLPLKIFSFPPSFENSKISLQPSIYGGKDTMKNIQYLATVIWTKNYEHKFKSIKLGLLSLLSKCIWQLVDFSKLLISHWINIFKDFRSLQSIILPHRFWSHCISIKT